MQLKIDKQQCLSTTHNDLQIIIKFVLLSS